MEGISYEKGDSTMYFGVIAGSYKLLDSIQKARKDGFRKRISLEGIKEPLHYSCSTKLAMAEAAVILSPTHSK